MTTTPEAKCEHRYIGKDAGAACPDCTPPKPADVAKVCMPTREFLRLPESAQKHIGAIEAERDALAAKVDGLSRAYALANDAREQLARVLMLSGAEVVGLRAELTAERERVVSVDGECRLLRELIMWALGEGGRFPDRPSKWDGRKYKPWFWWRTELRKRFEALTSTTKADEGEQK